MKINMLIFLGLLLIVQVSYANSIRINSGKELYQVYCAQCHGIEGDGYGINATEMEVLPKDHTDTEEMNARTDADLFKAIKHGGKAVDKSVLMPNWDANLSDEQIDDLVMYLRVLCCQKDK